MTEKLYWADPYIKEFDAAVASSDGAKLILDKTAFYPTGGGQPNDTGSISAGGEDYKVVDVKQENGEVVHFLDRPFSSSQKQVKGTIDWDRRYSLMRHHTALHVVGAVMEKDYHAKFTGGMIYVDRAHMDWDMPELNKELSEKIVEKSNEIIGKDMKVVSKFIKQDEALSIPDLVRTEPGKELIKRLEIVRIVQIGDFDTQSDGGTHVANTKEIGKVVLSRFDNKGSHRKRMEIKLA